MTTLVTGGTGQIAAALVRALAQRAEPTVVLSRREFPAASVLPPSVEWHVVPWPEIPAGLIIDRNISTVFHLASQTSAYTAREQPRLDVTEATSGLLALVEAIRDSGTRPALVFAGAVTQAGSSAAADQLDSAQQPETFYDVVKCCSELLLAQAVREGWLAAISVRLSNVYGMGHGSGSLPVRPDLPPAETSGPSGRLPRGFLDRAIHTAAVGGEIVIFGDGLYRRDYIHVNDVIDAFLLCPALARQRDWLAVSLGTGQGHAVKDAVETAMAVASEVLGATRCTVTHVPFPAWTYGVEERDTSVPSRRFRSLTGWQPQFDLRAGVRNAMEAYRD